MNEFSKFMADLNSIMENMNNRSKENDEALKKLFEVQNNQFSQT